ncbi:MAG: InlB B-repeat-containing protein [Eubacteriales bacterium]|nr:InlB B-repeat-containing protein [Eubacteriales bacterium]MDY3332882.1 InlB B-repeat-containing protein [Gallibacter sp.]
MVKKKTSRVLTMFLAVVIALSGGLFVMQNTFLRTNAQERIEYDSNFARAAISNVRVIGNVLKFDYTKVSNNAFATSHPDARLRIQLDENLRDKVVQVRSQYWYNKRLTINQSSIGTTMARVARIDTLDQGEKAYSFLFTANTGDDTNPNQSIYTQREYGVQNRTVTMQIEFAQGTDLAGLITNDNIENYLKISVVSSKGITAKSIIAKNLDQIQYEGDNPTEYPKEGYYKFNEGDSNMQFEYEPTLNAIIIDMKYRPYGGSATDWTHTLRMNTKLADMVEHYETWRIGMSGSNEYTSFLQAHMPGSVNAVQSTNPSGRSLAKRTGIMTGNQNTGPNLPIDDLSRFAGYSIQTLQDGTRTDFVTNTKKIRQMDEVHNFYSTGVQRGRIILYLKDNPATLLRNSDGTFKKELPLKFENFFLKSGKYSDNSYSQCSMVLRDSDQDGLLDEFENYLGSNPYNKDTDGDGKNDGAEFDDINKIYAQQYVDKLKYAGTGVNTAPPEWEADQNSIPVNTTKLTFDSIPENWKGKVLEVVLIKKDKYNSNKDYGSSSLSESDVTYLTKNSASWGIKIDSTSTKTVVNVPTGVTLEKGDRLLLRLWQDGDTATNTSAFTKPEISDFRIIGESTPTVINKQYSTELKVTGIIPAGTGISPADIQRQIKVQFNNINIPNQYLSVSVDNKMWEISLKNPAIQSLLEDAGLLEERDDLSSGRGLKPGVVIHATASQNGNEPAVSKDEVVIKGPKFNMIIQGDSEARLSVPSGTQSVNFLVTKVTDGSELYIRGTKVSDTEFKAILPADYKFKEDDKVEATITIGGRDIQSVGTLVRGDVIEDPTTENPIEGYVRIKFDPTANGELSTTKNSEHIAFGKATVKVFDVKKDLTWKRALEKGLYVPTCKHSDVNYIFAKWKNGSENLFVDLPLSNTTVISADKTYTARYIKQDVLKINVQALGVDGKAFNWDKVIGTSDDIIVNIAQKDKLTGTATGTTYTLKIKKSDLIAGTFIIKDDNQKVDLETFDGRTLVYEITGINPVTTGNKYLTHSKTATNVDGKITNMTLTLQEMIDTKITVAWHTDVVESNRPQLSGTISLNSKTATFDLTKGDGSFYITEKPKPANMEWNEFISTNAILSVSGGTTSTAGTYVVTDSNSKKWTVKVTKDLANGTSKYDIYEVINLTFDTNGGTLASTTREVNFGEKLITVSQPTRTGYEFVGWTIKDETKASAYQGLPTVTTKDNWDLANAKFTNASPVFANKTVHAVWRNTSIILHPNYEGVQDSDKKRVDLTSENISSGTLDLPDVYQQDKFKREGYSLIGFSTNPSATVPDIISAEGETTNYLNNLEKNYKLPASYKDDGLVLYAVWKENFTVKAKKTWQGNQPQDYKMYMALITRTAVGTFGSEVVIDDATYYPYPGSPQEYKGADLTWTNLPSYDRYGRRISYIIVELTESQKAAFDTHRSDDWSDYGITITKTQGATIGHKEQQIKLTEFDGYTSVTKRMHTTAQHEEGLDPQNPNNSVGYYDTTGYIINVTNTRLDVAKPIIQKIYSGDTDFDLDLDGPADKVTGKIKGVDYTLIKEADGWKVENGTGNNIASVTLKSTSPYRLVIKLNETSFSKDDEVTATAHVKVSENVFTHSDEDVEIVKDREVSRLPKDLKQIPNVKEGDKTYTVIEANENTEIGSHDVGLLLSRNTVYTLCDESGNPITIDGNTVDTKASYEGADKGKIIFKIPHDTGNNGKKYRIKVQEPERTPATTTETVTVDTVGPELIVKKLEGYTKENLTPILMYTTEPAKLTLAETLPEGIVKTELEFDAETQLYKKWQLEGKSDVILNKTIAITPTDYYGNIGTVKNQDIVIKDRVQVVPDPNNPGTTPEGYKLITFDSDNGTLETGGVKKSYFVANNSTWSQAKSAGMIVPKYATKDGTNFLKWNNAIPADAFVINQDMSFVAQYHKDVEVVNDTSGETPDRYLRITFNSKEDGQFEGDKDKLVLEVKNSITWEKIKASVQLPNPITTDKHFIGWDPKLPDNSVTAENGTKTFDAQYAGDIIEVTNPDNPTPDGYVRITFNAGSGNFESSAKTKTFDVHKDVVWSNFMSVVPTANAQLGYNFTKWDPNIPKTAEDKAKTVEAFGKFTFTAQYATDVVVDTTLGTDDDKPSDNYVSITFDADGKGSLIGQTKYYVIKDKPNVRLSDNQVPQVTNVTIGYNFTTWNMNVTNPQTFTDNVNVKALYETLKNVIVDPTPDDDNDKPNGYHTVRFNIDSEKGTVEGHTKYYVKPGTDLNTVNAPTVTAKTGFKKHDPFWDKNLSGAVNDNITINGQFDSLNDVIKVDPSQPTPPEKPDGYVTVEFKAGTDGTLNPTGQTTKYYVNPTKSVTLDAPAVKGNTGKIFKNWDKNYENVTFNEDTVINAVYESIKDVVPVENPDVTQKPDGYKTVIFEAGSDGTITSGITQYYVNPEKSVTLEPPVIRPNYGYSFKEWNSGFTNRKFTDDTTTITALYKKDVIAVEDPAQPPEHPADYVLVKFESGENGTIATGVTKQFYVNPTKEVTLTAPAVTAKTGYTFKEWDKPYVNQKFTTETTIEATYDPIDDKIAIPDPENPPAKPAGYVLVKFDADTNGQLVTGVTSQFYVNPTKEVTLTAPGVTANTGYTFKEWDKPFENQKFALETTIKARYNTLPSVIPVKDGVDKPAGYYTVTFNVDTDKGEVATGNAVKYYVKPDTALSEITPPTVTAKTGYEKKAGNEFWTPALPTIITCDAETTAQFKTLDAVIPAGDGVTKPDGYKFVEFVKGDNGEITSGTTKFYVNPTKQVTLEAPTVTPNVGYSNAGWNGAYINTTFENDTVIKALYTSEDDVKVTEQEGYKKVTFVAGDNGVINSGTTTFYVNPTKQVTLTAPVVKPNTGYKFTGWNKVFVDTTFTADETIITAKYEKLPSVIPAGDGVTKPEGYHTVTFNVDTDKGEVATGNAVKYYVEPGTASSEITPPTVTAKTGYEKKSGSEFWDPALPTTITGDAETTAQFKTLDSVIPVKDAIDKPAGYYTVTFYVDSNKGEVATGNAVKYYVKPDTASSEITPPTVTAKTGYEKKAGSEFWDPALPTTITGDAETTAQFKTLDAVIPAGDGVTKPSGYNAVEFVAGDNGNITAGTAKYYVNPNVDVTLAVPTVEANTGYTFTGWDINPTVARKYTEDTTTITAQYKEKDAVIKIENPNNPPEKPAGYKLVVFEQGANGRITSGESQYYVNPNVDVTLAAPTVEANTGYTFTGWDLNPTVARKYTDERTTITAQYKQTVKEQDPTNPPVLEDGYNRIIFNAGEGTFGGTATKKVYDVLEGTKWANGSVQAVIPTDIRANDSAKSFYEWNNSIPEADKEVIDFETTAQYKANIIVDETPTDDTDRPKGYNSVTYVVDATKGTVTAGNVKYYVKSGTSSAGITDPTVTANAPKYKLFNPLWSPEGLPSTISQDLTIKAQFITVITGDKYKMEIVNEEVEPGTPADGIDLTDNILSIKDSTGKDVPVTNKENIPPQTPIDTNTPGTYEGLVKITYEDGTTEVVAIPVIVLQPLVTIKYDPNGGVLDGTTIIKSVAYRVGTVITVEQAPTRAGYKFLYWKGSEYQPGASYKVVGNHTFVAQWEKVTDNSNNNNNNVNTNNTNSSKTKNKTKASKAKDMKAPNTGDTGIQFWIILLVISATLLSIERVIAIRQKHYNK